MMGVKMSAILEECFLVVVDVDVVVVVIVVLFFDEAYEEPILDLDI